MPILLVLFFFFSLLGNECISADQRWTSVGPYGLNAFNFQLNEQQPNLIFTGDGIRAVFRSDNFGASWRRVPAEGIVRVHPKDGKSVIVFNYDELIVSSDSGRKWQKVFDFKQMLISDIQFHPENPNTLYTLAGRCDFYKSVDSGRNWTRQAGDGLPSAEGCTSYGFSLSAGSQKKKPLLYINSNRSRIYRSTDEGITWQAASSGLPCCYKIFNLALDRKDSANAYAATGIGIYKTSNSGKTWIKVQKGPFFDISISQQNPLMIYAVRSRRVYPGGSGGMRSTDGGISWKAINLNQKWSYYTIAVNPQISKIIFAGSDERGILRSTDYGNTWQVSTRGLNELSINNVFMNGSILFANSLTTLFKSTDGGRNWKILNLKDLEGCDPLHVTGNPNNPNVIIVGCDATTLISYNSGSSWEKIPISMGEFVLFDPTNPKVFFNVELQSIKRTTDGGRTFQKLPFPKIPSTTSIKGAGLSADNPSTIFVGTELDGVFKSTDSGKTWKKIAYLMNTILQLEVHPKNPSVVYVRTDLGGSSLDYHEGLYRTNDAGRTWKLVHEGFFGKIVLVPKNALQLYGMESQIIFSNDGGINFSVVSNQGLPPNTLPNDLALGNDDGSSLAFATNRGIYRLRR